LALFFKPVAKVKQYKFVLYADDDVDDKDWVTDACKAVDQTLQMVFVDNGRQVIDYLLGKPAQMPALIVLDLNMPELDGRQTLQKLKSLPEYQEIPVAIVTTSANNMDREVCQRLGASIYLTKPDTHKAWQDIVRQLLPFVVK
jgi:CheY-like chemotaxis protein